MFASFLRLFSPFWTCNGGHRHPDPGVYLRVQLFPWTVTSAGVLPVSLTCQTVACLPHSVFLYFVFPLFLACHSFAFFVYLDTGVVFTASYSDSFSPLRPVYTLKPRNEAGGKHNRCNIKRMILFQLWQHTFLLFWFFFLHHASLEL